MIKLLKITKGKINMIISKLEGKIFSEEWLKSVFFNLDQIPDNTVFSMVYPEKREDKPLVISKTYVKFNSEYFVIEKESKKAEDDDILFTKRAVYSELATDFVEEDFFDFNNAYRNALIEKSKQDSDAYQLSEEDIKAFSVNGIEAKPVIGACWYMRHASRIDYDDVQYAISFHSDKYEQNKESAAHGVNHLEQIKQRHHHIVKDIYNFLKGQYELGDIWVLVGGGCQIQAFFGNKKGYIGILYLDMDTPQENAEVNDGYLKCIGNEKFTLEANFTENNKYFKGFKHPKVKFRKSDYTNE